jgi:hypothetical protein
MPKSGQRLFRPFHKEERKADRVPLSLRISKPVGALDPPAVTLDRPAKPRQREKHIEMCFKRSTSRGKMGRNSPKLWISVLSSTSVRSGFAAPSMYFERHPSGVAFRGGCCPRQRQGSVAPLPSAGYPQTSAIPLRSRGVQFRVGSG